MYSYYMQPKNTTKGILALIIVTTMFASIGIFSRYMQTSFHLFQQTYLRMGGALLFGFIFFGNDLHITKLRKIPLKDWLLLIIRSFSNYVGGVILFTLAVFNTSLGNVSLIQALPFIAIFGIIFFKEKSTKGKVFFLLLSFLGVVILSINNIHEIFVWGKGQTLSLISAFFFSFAYISRRWQSRTLNNKEMTQIMLFFAVIFLLLGSFFFKEGLPTNGWNPTVIIALLVSAFFNVAMLFLINYGFGHVQPFLASNILTLEGFFAIILGFLIYREIPMAKDVIGGILIVIAVIGMNYMENSK